MHERLEKIKQHIIDHKVTYIACGATAVVTGAAVYIAVKLKSTEVSADVQVDKLNFKWKSPTTNNVTVTLTPRGDLGNPVRCIETGEIFESQRYAAIAKGLNPGNLVKHLNGEREHISGLHFERLPWTQS